MRRLRSTFGRIDGLLAVGAILGFGLFVWLLPQQHPLAAAEYLLDERAAADRASAFLAADGHPVEALEVEAQFRSDGDLLQDLQALWGRPAAIDTIQRLNDVLPAYYWEVNWSREADGEDEQYLTMRLTEHGHVVGMERHGDGEPMANRRALASLIRPVTPNYVLPGELSDSLLTGGLRFAPADTSWGSISEAPAAGAEAAMDTTALGFLQEGTPLELRPSEARALAQYHVERTALAELPLRADSVWLTTPAEDPTRARVRFVSSASVGGFESEAEVEVGAAGALHALDTRFVLTSEQALSDSRPAAGEEGLIVLQMRGERIAELLPSLTWVALVLLFLALFLRRLSQRLIDAKATLRDAVLGGLLVGVFTTLMAMQEVAAEASPGWGRAGMLAVIFLSTGFLASALLFIISSPADSYARAAWPEKLSALSLVRRMRWRNVPVGKALLRGLMLGGLLLGLATLVLVLLPGQGLSIEEMTEAVLSQLVPLRFVFVVAYYGWMSLLLMLAVLLGVAALLYRWSKRGGVVLLGVTAILTLLQVAPYTLEPLSYSFLPATVLGATLAWAFWRYDALTCFFGYFVMGLFWGTAPAWLVAGYPGVLDMALVLLGAAGMFGLGWAGVQSGRDEKEAGEYVPNYVREIAQRERLEHEIELAQQVQNSFLPRRMPDMEGVDIAAMCLAAYEVGGDYYDFIDLGAERLGVVIGDVSGKGIQAAFFMTLAKGFLQTLAREDRSPAEVLCQLNAHFYEHVPRGTFISMIYGVLDTRTGTFTFARAGHNPLLLHTRSDGAPVFLQPPGMAIGLTDGARFDTFIEEKTVQLNLGDVLVLYTDGLTEAVDAEGNYFGEEGLRLAVANSRGETARDFLRAVSDKVYHFVEEAGRHDDMTMVVLRRTARTTHPAPKANNAADSISTRR